VEDLQYQTLANDLQIVVVDNASPNNSYMQLKPLEEQFSNVKVLQTGANLGYAKGNNFGLNYLNQNVKPIYVAILNNDVYLPKNCFEKLIEKYQILDKPAIIAPLQKSIDGHVAILGNVFSFMDDILSQSFLYRVLNKNKIKLIDNTQMDAMKVEMITGSFMFSSFDIFKEIGFFYPNTFLYVEERFIAYAAKKKGYNNYVLLKEEYIHNHSLTINSLHNAYSKYKMVHKGIIEYTIHCRNNGKLKAVILRPLMRLSLLEIKIVYWLKDLLKKINDYFKR